MKTIDNIKAIVSAWNFLGVQTSEKDKCEYRDLDKCLSKAFVNWFLPNLLPTGEEKETYKALIKKKLSVIKLNKYENVILF